MLRHVWSFALLLTLLPMTPASAQVQKYVCVVLDHDTGILYNCDLTTGQVSSPRPTGVKGGVGIAFFNATNSLFTVTDDQGKPVPDALYGINPYTGRSTLIGKTGLRPIQGGDLCYDPKNKTLYGLQVGVAPSPRKLFRVNPKTGVGTVLLSIPNPKKGARNINSLTLDKASAFLYATDGQQETLLQIDPDTGRILTEKPLSDFIGPACGLRLNRYGDNRCYLADGGAWGTHSLYVLDIETAVLTKVGDLKGPNAIDGLTFIPKTPRTL